MRKILTFFLVGLCWLPLAVKAQSISGPQGAPQTIGTWTPADGSGQSLVFTGVSAKYTQIGNMVFAYAQVTYPSNVNATQAAISGFPVNPAAANYARNCHVSFASVAAYAIFPGNGAAGISFYVPATGAAMANSVLSNQTIIFECIYPAQ